jgi:hypothetical protein
MRVGDEPRLFVLRDVLGQHYDPCRHIVYAVRHVDGVAGRERRLHLLGEERVQASNKLTSAICFPLTRFTRGDEVDNGSAHSDGG